MNRFETSSAGPSRGRDNYYVVARRYRPQTFGQIIGQDHVVQVLTSAIETHRVGHAYLFTGARGVGKTSAARILAKALNCVEGPTVTPCCRCETCVAVGGGEDVDVLEIDGASNRGIDEIRQLRHNVGIRPSRSRYKIYIIDEVHMLTKEAFNALLKTLEEPPAHVKFVFATTEPSKIPTTILSRCQRFDFAGVEPRQIAERLRQIAEAEGVSVDEQALELLARMAEGSLRDSQSLLERLLASGQRSLGIDDVHHMLGILPATRIARIARLIADHQPAEAILELDAAFAEGCEPEQLLEQLLGYQRDIMLAAVGGKPEQFRYAPASLAADVEKMARQFGAEKSLAAVQILHQAISSFRNSLHGRILAETALVRIARLDLTDDLAQLVAELRGEPSCRAGPHRPAPTTPQSAESGSIRKEIDSARSSNLADELARASSTLPAGEDAASLPHDRDSTPRSSETSRPDGGSHQFAVELWREVIRRLGERSELVADQAGFFSDVIAGEGGLLVVRFPARYTSCMNFCEEPSQKAKLEAALQELTGAPARLKFALDAESDHGVESAESPVSRRQMQLEIAGRPIVKRAVELFEGSSLKVTPKG
jgi:DNA polymerase-3 subunit gamma/tau